MRICRKRGGATTRAGIAKIWRAEGSAKEELSEEISGLSERYIDAEGERRLKEAGFLPQESRLGKRLWKDPDTGRVMPGGSALDEVERREGQELEEAGWEHMEVEGESYWSKPDSGRLYPRGAAYDTHKKGIDQE